MQNSIPPEVLECGILADKNELNPTKRSIAMGKTESALAQFALSYPAEQIPPEVMHLAKRCLMNHLGVALFATLDPAIEYCA